MHNNASKALSGHPVAIDLRNHAEAVSPDPFPRVKPTVAPDRTWVYRRTDFELARLGRLVAESFAANRFVHYALNFERPAQAVQYRTQVTQGMALEFTTPGHLEAWADGTALTVRTDAAGSHCHLETDTSGVALEVRVTAPPGQPAVFAMPAHAGDSSLTWIARRDEGDPWMATLPRPGGRIAPHEATRPDMHLQAHRVGNSDLYELPAPVVGRPVITSRFRPEFTTGESAAEALSPATASESLHDPVQTGPETWISAHRLGFRYLRVVGSTADTVDVMAHIPQIDHRGAFACSDDTLTRIWSVSAYTLRSCMQDLVVDGIKRDRMPWVGDQALSTLANAFTFGNRTLTRDSLVALGQPTHGYVNGISDYSLWWLITTDLYLGLFGDDEHARREAENIHAFTRNLAAHADDRGYFMPADQADGFEDADSGSIFIDWGVTVEANRTYVPLQMLWHWALSAASRILSRANHPAEQYWRDVATGVASALRQDAWLTNVQGWSEYIGGEPSTAPHADFLGILSGLTPVEHIDSAGERLAAAPRAGTPFMTTFMLRALAVTGRRQEAISAIRRLWGDMLTSGTRTFWEEFATDDESPYAMYGRPFGKSLCHAWSSGPAALLPETVLGLRPLSDGWAQFTVDPSLGSLEWAGAVVPSRFGDIVVKATTTATTILVPEGTEVVLPGRSYAGPCEISLGVRDSGTPVHHGQSETPVN